MTDLTLTSCRLPDRLGLFDVALASGRIKAITTVGAGVTAGATLDLRERLLLPALADGHLHLDKTFTGSPWRPHVHGHSIAERITAERTERSLVPLALKDRALRLVDRVMALGTLAIRSHVDVDESVGLTHVEALLELREALDGRIDLQLAAFPQNGLRGSVPDLLDEALALGVEVVGGLDPACVDNDIDGHLDVVFALAEKHGRRVDIHLHDGGELGAYELRRIAQRAGALGLHGRVAVSHAFALGMIGSEDLRATADALASGGVAIMTNGPGPDAMPPLNALMDAGVTVFGGSDNIRDAWSPFGDGDLLRRAGMIAYRGNFRTDDELRRAFTFVTDNSRKVMGLELVSLSPGSPADLIAVKASDIPEAVADPPSDRLVIRRGVVLHGG